MSTRRIPSPTAAPAPASASGPVAPNEAPTATQVLTPPPAPTVAPVPPSDPQGTQTFPDRRQSAEGFEGEDRRDARVDRRAGLSRRVMDIGSPTGLERRRGPGLRRTDDRRSAEEGEMTDEQFEFVLAVDTYKRLNNRPFPTWTEVLEVVKQLGYRKVAASELSLPSSVSRASTQIQNPPKGTGSKAAESDYLPG